MVLVRSAAVSAAPSLLSGSALYRMKANGGALFEAVVLVVTLLRAMVFVVQLKIATEPSIAMVRAQMQIQASLLRL